MSSTMFDLSGKRALVTGASPGGLGEHCARALAMAGAAVILSDLEARRAELDESADALREESGREVASVTADLTSEQEVIDLVQHVGAAGVIDIVVGAAGAMMRKSTLDTSLDEWHAIMNVNLTASFLLNREVARLMIDRGTRGRIINVSSIYANIVGPIPEPAYYASKAAVANMTRGLAAEWGPAGINVNCLAPGVFFPTRMTAALADDPGRLSSMAGRTLLKRLGDPAQDLGGTVVWLASEAASYVTGQVIYVDGGWTAN